MKLEYDGKIIRLEIDPTVIFTDDPDEWHVSCETFQDAVGREVSLHVSYNMGKERKCLGIHGIVTGIGLEERHE